MKFVARSSVEVCRAYLSVHLFDEHIQKGHALGMNVELNIYEKIKVFVKFIGIFVHKLFKRGAFDVVHRNGPAAVHYRYSLNFGYVEVGFLNARLIERFVEDVSLGIALIKELYKLVAVPVNLFARSFDYYFFVFHYHNPPYLP